MYLNVWFLSVQATEDLVKEGLPAGVYGVPAGGQPGYNGEVYPGGIANAGTPSEEQWIDNKMSFMPVLKPEKVSNFNLVLRIVFQNHWYFLFSFSNEK